MRNLKIVVIAIFLQLIFGATSLPAQTDKVTRQETLRGSITPEREWWDLLHYHLKVEFLPETRRLKGSNTITFKTLKPGNRMQIDLQPPLAITKVTHGASQLKFEREEKVYWITFEKELPKGVEDKIEVFYEGVPVVSRNPPWVGGVTWGRDDLGEHFIVTTCQGIGASIWWPNKDHGADEPDRGMQISVTVPENLVAVSNGRLKKTDHEVAAKKKTYHWQVVNPINNYGVNVNIGNYVNFSEKYQGKGGVLDLEYWVLPHQKEAALKHFKEVRRTIEAFEHWFGQYPFYEDSYKLVTVSYPGMEHQSSVTYGNWFRNGYLQRDPCGCGVGFKFDFIIVHESAHEWFGNNISMKDAADMWIHEGFANYSENLFVEYHFGKKDAEDYVVGTRRGIRNDKPIIGVYNSNREGSGDMYPKGGNMLHTIRHVINDDAKWLSILRGLNADFRHQTVTTEQVETYISKKAGMDFSKVFDQYLRTTKIPLLKYSVNGNTVTFNYERVVAGFAMPLRVSLNGKEIVIKPTEAPQTYQHFEEIKTFEVNRNFYVEAERQRAVPATTELKNTLQAKLDEWHKAGAFPGATFGVALANGESFGLAVGVSDRTTKTPMKPTDRMPAGSVGKTFAAATALQLIKEGKIGLDDKVEKYLGREPWFSRLPNAKDITVRMLMNHTSGLVRYEFKEQFTKDLTANPGKVWKPAELVAYLLDEKAPFEAGKGWDYSDTNYIVLGMIIEKVTGRKFYDEANRRVLKPLKLTETRPQDGPRLPIVQGYAGPNNPFGGTDEMIVNGKFAVNPQFEWTGGGYISTAHDLARWAKMMYEGKAYSPELLPQVFDGVAAPMLGRETKYGLGVIIRRTPLGTAYGHSGFFPGYMTDMLYFPEHKIAVAVQVNTSVGRNLGKPLSRVLIEAMEVIIADH